MKKVIKLNLFYSPLRTITYSNRNSIEMPFEKGVPKPGGKTGGRLKGSLNKTTPEIREAIQKVMSSKIDELESDLEKMNPFQQWMILEKVAKYFMPALNKNEDTVEHTGEVKITVCFSNGNTDATGDYFSEGDN